MWEKIANKLIIFCSIFAFACILSFDAPSGVLSEMQNVLNGFLTSSAGRKRLPRPSLSMFDLGKMFNPDILTSPPEAEGGSGIFLRHSRYEWNCHSNERHWVREEEGNWHLFHLFLLGIDLGLGSSRAILVRGAKCFGLEMETSSQEESGC